MISRKILSAFVLLASGFLLTESAIQPCEGQLLPIFRQASDSEPYSPDDPQTRGRLFNLQTGHAGAFYNCDGEEDKRYSHHICWKSSHGSPWYRTISDVLRWKRDRNEIAQRICDGAGACCRGKCDVSACGCAECAGVTVVEIAEAEPVVRSPNQGIAVRVAEANQRIRSSVLQSSPALSGLISSGALTPKLIRKTTGVAASQLVEAETETACQCAACKKRALQSRKGETSVAAKAQQNAKLLNQSEQSEETVRSASLLQRVRAATKR